MLPKTKGHVKNYNGQTKWMHFLIEVSVRISEKNLIANLFSIKNLWEPKKMLIVMRLQIFAISKPRR